jgi:hypothetical protein
MSRPSLYAAAGFPREYGCEGDPGRAGFCPLVKHSELGLNLRTQQVADVLDPLL